MFQEHLTSFPANLIYSVSVLAIATQIPFGDCENILSYSLCGCLNAFYNQSLKFFNDTRLYH